MAGLGGRRRVDVREGRVIDDRCQRAVEVDPDEGCVGVAHESVGNLSQSWFPAFLTISAGAHPAFEELQVSDLKGTVIASTRPEIGLSTTPSGDDFAHSLSVETMGPVGIGQVGLDWLVTAPILGPDEKPQGVVVGDLNVAVLGKLINPYGVDAPITRNEEIHIVNMQHLLLFSSDWAIVTDDAALRPAGHRRSPGAAAGTPPPLTRSSAHSPHVVMTAHHIGLYPLIYERNQSRFEAS